LTTIAFKNGVLAADTQATCSYHSRVRKIHRMPDGVLLGGCGSTQDCHLVAEWLKGGQEGKLPRSLEADFIIVLPNGSILIAEGRFPPFPLTAKFAAIGSGSPVAMGAMEAGATALEAVKIAAKHDGGTSGPFHTLRLR